VPNQTGVRPVVLPLTLAVGPLLKRFFFVDRGSRGDMLALED
jgi:hypothetical protein